LSSREPARAAQRTCDIQWKEQTPKSQFNAQDVRSSKTINRGESLDRSVGRFR
jgi:hypothetical protein